MKEKNVTYGLRLILAGLLIVLSCAWDGIKNVLCAFAWFAWTYKARIAFTAACVALVAITPYLLAAISYMVVGPV